MGTYYKIANSAKRQYLAPEDFGSSGKNTWVLTEHLGLATALLVGRFEDGAYRPLHPLLGSWHGDAVLFAADNAPGDRPSENLYAACWREFQNISLPALAMVLAWREDAAEQLVRRGAPDPVWGWRRLRNLRDLMDGDLLEPEAIGRAMEAELGADWRERLKEPAE